MTWTRHRIGFLVVALVLVLGVVLLVAGRRGASRSRREERSALMEPRLLALDALRTVAAVVEGFREEHGRLPSVAEFYSPEVYGLFEEGERGLDDPCSGERLVYWLDNASDRGYSAAFPGFDGIPGTDDDVYLDEALEIDDAHGR